MSVLAWRSGWRSGAILTLLVIVGCGAGRTSEPRVHERASGWPIAVNVGSIGDSYSRGCGVPEEDVQTIELPNGREARVGRGLTGGGHRIFLSSWGQLVVVSEDSQAYQWHRELGTRFGNIALAEGTVTEGGSPVLMACAFNDKARVFFDLESGQQLQPAGEELNTLFPNVNLPHLPGLPMEPRFVTGARSMHQTEMLARMDTQEAWEEFWRSHAVKEPLPQIDFTSSMVIVRTCGVVHQMTGYRLHAAMITDDVIALYVDAESYQIGVPVKRNEKGEWVDDPEGMKQYEHTPYFWCVLPKSHMPVTVWQNCNGYIGGTPVYRKIASL